MEPSPAAPVVVLVIGSGFQARGLLPVDGPKRVSDHINERRVILHLDQVEFGKGPHHPVAELGINRDHILMVIPLNELELSEEQIAERMVAKAPHPIRLMVADWVIEGDLHLPPGTTPERYINLSEAAFIPVTDVTLTSEDGELVASLVLISRRQIQVMMRRDSEGSASSPTPKGRARGPARGSAGVPPKVRARK